MHTQKELIDHLVARSVLVTSDITSAFEKVDRRDFVPATLSEDEIYADRPLPIGHAQTISQPTTVAIMLELLQPQKGDNVLDVGSGSGWTTALLSQIVGPEGRVYGVEIVSELVAVGHENIEKYDCGNASIQHAGHVIGLPAHAPFDRILVSAASDQVPEDLIDQLRPGGVMIAPVQNSLMQYLKKKDGEITHREYYGFSFVPLVNPER